MGEQFQTEVRFETLDEIGYSVEALAGSGGTIEKRIRILDGARDELQWFVRRVAAVGVTRYEISSTSCRRCRKFSA